MKILINRTDAIGDCLLSTPLARLLKDKIKDESVEITFLVSPRSGDLIGLCEGIDKVVIYDPKWSWFKRLQFLGELLKKERYDVFFHLGGALLPLYQAWKARIKIRAGLQSKWATFLFLNKGQRQSRRLVTMHESDYNMDLAQALGIHRHGERLEAYGPKLNVTKDEGLKARREEGIEDHKKLVIVHPGMSGHTLNWASRNYGRLIERLYEDDREAYRFIVSYTPSDGPYLEGLKDYISSSEDLQREVLFFDGSKKGLIHFTHLLKGADLFIGPSTGTTHMANALGVAQVGIYSPIKVQSSHRWGPYRRDKKAQVVVPDVVCGESTQCAGAICPYYECMAKIEVEDIFKAAKRALK